jgi:hypothetical protein
MYESDAKLKALIESGGMEIEPDPVRMEAVRERMLRISRTPAARIVRPRTIAAMFLALVTICIVGVAATETGRKIIRWIYTPLGQATVRTFSIAPDANAVWGVARVATDGVSAGGISDQEAEEMKRRFTEAHQIAQAGGGRLTGLLEVPGHTTYVIEYRLSDGTYESVGSSRPTGLQAANMRIDEIEQLRDAGHGQLLLTEDFPIGLGRFKIRFTLSNGEVVDLVTNYPPGTRQEREAIFAETRSLKQARQFSVLDASRDPRGRTFGILRYRLADGRVVGVSEDVPQEVVSSNGKMTVVAETEHTAGIHSGGFANEKEASKVQKRGEELLRIAEAGGGRLSAIIDRLGLSGEEPITVYRIECTLGDGTNETMNTNVVTGKQRTNLRLDEILALRDAGQGQLVGRGSDPERPGLYSVRYTLSDGRTVDIDTTCPPCTRQQREAMFAEIRQLKEGFRFSVREPVRKSGVVRGVLRYNLSDGRTLELYDFVPREAISADGKYVVVPGSAEKVEIGATPAPLKK